MESESAPFVAAIFIQLLGSTRSNLLYQRVSPRRKREGAGVTKDEKKCENSINKEHKPMQGLLLETLQREGVEKDRMWESKLGHETHSGPPEHL